MRSPVEIDLENLPSGDALNQARNEIQRTLAEGGSRLAELNWSIMRNAAGKSLREALGKLDVLDFVAGAWCTAAELREIATKTLKEPGTEDTLALAEHDPSVLLHPVVKIKCGPVELPALTFDLKLGATVECAVLVISGGKLKAIEAGTFKPFASLSYGDREINRVDGDEVSITRRFNFPGEGIVVPCSEAETVA